MYGVFMGYSWGIHGVFMGYTYVSGMCRVCIGYVSGMCREYVERNGMRVGSSNFMQDNLYNEYIINNLNNIYFSTTCCAQNNTLRATREMGKRQWRQLAPKSIPLGRSRKLVGIVEISAEGKETYYRPRKSTDGHGR